MDHLDLRDIEQFLYREARYIDNKEYDNWLSLFTADAHYWIPCNGDDRDPELHVSIVYDDRARMEERVQRLRSGIAYGQLPESKTRHLVTNVMLQQVYEEEVHVYSNFLIAEMRRGIQTTYVGHCVHQLVRDSDGEYKSRYKTVYLINNDQPVGNLSFLL